MSLWRDEKFLKLVSAQLDRFSSKSHHLYNFRCPLCGDSEHVKSKARGYVFPKNDILMFKCHNCSVALPFSALLKRLNRSMYDQYMLERLQDDGSHSRVASPPDATVPPPEPVPTPGRLLALSDCTTPQNPLYPVYEYAHERMIPDAQLHRLAATNKAQSWVLPLVGEEKAKRVEDGKLYLVFPLTLPDGSWYGAQLRMLREKQFATFRWQHEGLKVFGLDAWSPKQTTYILESPIDSLFVPNGIAACGSDLEGCVRALRDMNLLLNDDYVYVWDNEPRNKDVCRHMRNAIALRERLVIWPSHFRKDINDMVRHGLRPISYVPDILERCTYSGLKAELEFSTWKK